MSAVKIIAMAYIYIVPVVLQSAEVSSNAAAVEEQPLMIEGQTSLDSKAPASAPPCAHTPTPTTTEESSEGEYTDMFDADEDYDGPMYASQPSYTGKHGAPYTPPGWKRKRVKRIKLMLNETLDREKEEGSQS